jgi:hypothetical protein
MAKQDLRCTHCGTPIMDRQSMIERENQVFCCRNCELAMASRETGSSEGLGWTGKE